jgi:deoxyribodipyrimidine photolyase-related protein
MSDFPKENWQFIWDALFWQFLNKHRYFFKSNPRLALLLKTYDNFLEHKKEEIKTTYESWMCKL